MEKPVQQPATESGSNAPEAEPVLKPSDGVSDDLQARRREVIERRDKEFGELDGKARAIITRAEQGESRFQEIAKKVDEAETKVTSIASQGQEVLDKANEHRDAISKSKTQVDGFVTELFGPSGSSDDGIEQKVKKSQKVIEEVEASHKGKLEAIQAFHDNVLKDEAGDDGTPKKFGLKSEVEQLRDQLKKLVAEATDKLHALTDQSLHNAFAKRAESYSVEFKELERHTQNVVLGIVGVVAAFGLAQLVIYVVGKPFNYNLLIFQFSIIGALVFLLWMYNRNQKMAKKLAEDYHHKAALAEAMTGYRHLYGLKHSDEEYMRLFDSIKDALNVNPSAGIDRFLNLKSPHEDIASTVERSVDRLQQGMTEAVKSALKDARG